MYLCARSVEMGAQWQTRPRLVPPRLLLSEGVGEVTVGLPTESSSLSLSAEMEKPELESLPPLGDCPGRHRVNFWLGSALHVHIKAPYKNDSWPAGFTLYMVTIIEIYSVKPC